MLSSDRHCTCGHMRKKHDEEREPNYDSACQTDGCSCEYFISPGPRTIVRHRSSDNDGKPHFQHRAAVCYECGDWATRVSAAKQTNFIGGVGADHFDEFAVHSEERLLIRYGCDEHFDEIHGGVCDDGGGHSSNNLDGVLELALKVEEYANMVWRQEHR